MHGTAAVDHLYVRTRVCRPAVRQKRPLRDRVDRLDALRRRVSGAAAAAGARSSGDSTHDPRRCDDAPAWLSTAPRGRWEGDSLEECEPCDAPSEDLARVAPVNASSWRMDCVSAASTRKTLDCTASAFPSCTFMVSICASRLATTSAFCCWSSVATAAPMGDARWRRLRREASSAAVTSTSGWNLVFSSSSAYANVADENGGAGAGPDGSSVRVAMKALYCSLVSSDTGDGEGANRNDAMASARDGDRLGEPPLLRCC